MELKEGYIPKHLYDKIKKLRKDRISEDLDKRQKSNPKCKKNFAVGDTVSISTWYPEFGKDINYKVGGVIRKKYGDKDLYDISTGLKLFKKVSSRYIYHRVVSDLSLVEGEPKLRNVSTVRLLKVFKTYQLKLYCNYWDNWVEDENIEDVDIKVQMLVPNYGLITVTGDQIRKELNSREHILNKKEKKFLKDEKSKK